MSNGDDLQVLTRQLDARRRIEMRRVKRELDGLQEAGMRKDIAIFKEMVAGKRVAVVVRPKGLKAAQPRTKRRSPRDSGARCREAGH